MKKNFIESRDIQIQFRSAGQGKPLVLLHASPRSSKVLEPFGNLLSADYQVIIPDIPGYGMSDALPIAPKSLNDYLPYFQAFFQKLGFQKFALYGTATGAQLSIAYALAYPNEVECLFLDNAAHFTQAQYEQIVGQYFPDFSPQPDGSHLIKLWQHLRDACLFFPWFDAQTGKRLSNGVPPAEILNEMALDYLIAGKNWDSAYRLAFAHERAEKIQALQVPTLVFRWQGSILLEYIEQLIMQGLPANVQVVDIPATMSERLAKMQEIIRNSLL
jgi:pimeloyl-ACP methyl ester carboxylesterase